MEPWHPACNPDRGYGIRRAQIHRSLLDPAVAAQWPAQPQGDDLVPVDLVVRSGVITQIGIRRAGEPEPALGEPGDDTPPWPTVDWDRGQIWPCFVDIHTHLDKGHSWERSPNPDGSFQGALAAVARDAQHHWSQGDLYARMDFGLRCSYSHGSQALRTHLDCGGALAPKVWEVFQQLRRDWSDRLILQGVSLVPGDYYLTPEGVALADRVAAAGGLLGAVLFNHPALDQHLDRILALAQERGLDLDFHTDESGNPDDRALHRVALAQQRHQFPGQITCGHCCSLSVQPPAIVAETLEAVAIAALGVVSLPLCNLYLQDRQPQRTPRWRGVTALQELRSAGIAVALASDNCRDPFYGFGDHDGLEVFRESVRIAHLDRPYGDWTQALTITPAQMMGLPHLGQIRVGATADLVLFRGRGFSELLSRPQGDRVVLRRGRAIDTTLPDYRELDPWVYPSG
ncbi:cytosine deaminase [Prochlorothrix hollandica]|uniref:Cytosine deaminase n=1 Tax=Prochlorothrix hollandica PCC 9006 = CALU 1027 TaxID=317619 RepID=A0A0M2PQC1_PROHO|nr:cytosine deaminase [Prochlorothrix hollandica]KKI98424.1 cytosine deaminase [Prochlorothrix hollandica PCC 9006 = CALU 1027]